MKPKQKKYLERAVKDYIAEKTSLSLEEWSLRHHPEIILSYLIEQAQGKEAKKRLAGEVIGRSLASIAKALIEKDTSLLSGAFCLLLKGIAEDVGTPFEKHVPTVQRALAEIPKKLRLFTEFEGAK